MRRLKCALLISLFGLTLTGFSLSEASSPPPAFHDIRINSIESYIDLIEPDDPDVIQLAKQFNSYEQAYRFVSEEIKFVPYVPSGPVKETLRHRVGSCIGKAALLCSLYRAMGLSQEEVRIVVGIVVTANGMSDHVWIDMEKDGKCLQQDPSGMLGRFGFYDFPGNKYVDRFVMKESFCFNDGHLAIVSQLNRMRHGAMR
jgi:transglutaminase-like putative cysteine protease